MRINKTFLAVITSIPFLVEGFLTHIIVIQQIYLVCRIISFCIIMFWYIAELKKVSHIMIVIFLYHFCLLFSTIINAGNILSYFSIAISNLGLCMLVEIMIKTSFRLCCLSILTPLVIMIITNLISIFLFPEGFGYAVINIISTSANPNLYWFLGYYNFHILVMLPAMYISLLYDNFCTDKIGLMSIFIMIISIVTTFYIWSATTIICVMMFTFYICFIYKKNNGSILNFRTYCIIVICFFILLVFFSIQENLAFFIENILKRTTTLTGRTTVWEQYIKYIIQKPIFGYGVENDIIHLRIANAVHAHNLYLQTLYWGGILLLTVFLTMVFIAGRKLMVYKRNIHAQILAFVFFIYAIRYLVEADLRPRYFFIWFIFAYHIDVIIKQREMGIDSDKINIAQSSNTYNNTINLSSRG